MSATDQCLKELQKRYFQTRSKKEKSSILNEYRQNTDQNRKYVIRKINSSFSSKLKKRKRRKRIYDGYVRTGREQVWQIFDYPCRQRPAPLLKNEVDRLRKPREILIPQDC